MELDINSRTFDKPIAALKAGLTALEKMMKDDFTNGQTMKSVTMYSNFSTALGFLEGIKEMINLKEHHELVKQGKLPRRNMP